eukprot:CAMPEP_0174740734 /NCGR_PEP_ID=MMETSP1094-20130205/74405_1 /TAXON_ID=156173 /ORGANISM="Chrysochromulina brevifilum, Strain UTEX LB 985" /LENGTH=60 /DNA_ID=CAMNT_0015944497 /DNA_START=581 /DNA_END=759 /DNA_ORIENTATION=+
MAHTGGARCSAQRSAPQTSARANRAGKSGCPGVQEGQEWFHMLGWHAQCARLVEQAASTS